MDDMDAVHRFRDQFTPQSEAEARWLEGLFQFVREHAWPLVPGPAPGRQTADEGASDLSARVLKTIRGKMGATRTLPVSYRPVCVSELVSHQRVACVSDLSRSAAREREAPTGQRALPRARLLLMGRLTHGPDGEWMLTDAGGSVRCEVVSPSPLWMGRLVFLPHWHYIPHDAPGQAQPQTRGYVELIGAPVLLCPGPAQGLDDGPVTITEAAALMRKRGRGRHLSVLGQVASVCPLLDISGTAFFFFTLSDGTHTLAVLVKKSSRLWWAQCVSVGECVCVTALRVCVLQSWGGKKVLCVTDGSQMHKTHQEAAPATPASRAEECEGPSEGGAKRSRVISYQGRLTRVVSAGAGLYVMDAKLGLCLAYQPQLKRKLRVGDTLALHHVHLLHQPCPDFPPGVLCTCLRSTVTVTEFSGVSGPGPGPERNCPDDGVLQRLLVERNPDVSRYLWACHLCSRLQSGLLPSSSSPRCTCVLSWKLMELAFGPGRRHRRDIYAEMLDEPHACPLTQYQGHPAQHRYVSLSELRESLQEDCWASLSLASSLPAAGVGLTRAQMNASLAWSSRTLTSDPGGKLPPAEALGERPLLLVGVVELPTGASFHTLQLRDRTGAVAFVLTETASDQERHTAAFDTAWIGCLVCVRHFTMVTERFVQSNFPTYQHLDQHKFITHKRCSIYLQFSQESVRILSPSVAMETRLRHKGEESERDGKEEKESEPGRSSSSPVTAAACVSALLRVERKDAVVWREDGGASFSVAAAAIGPPAAWGRDPRNEPVKDLEMGEERKVTLLCSGASARWFPLVQPGRSYRLVARGQRDAGVLAADDGLWVRPDWKFHTLTPPPTLLPRRGDVGPAPATVSQVLDGSADVVSFQGFVSERINLTDSTKDTGHTNIGARLTMCDQSGRSLHVFLNFDQKSYPPGLLPGNTLMLWSFRRRVSRSGRVYCSNIAVSWAAVLRVRDDGWEDRPPPPIMHLALWTLRDRTVGRVKGHVVCFLFMQLQWNCFECGSVFVQSPCSGRCLSPSRVFDCSAKLVLEDGTGQAHVRFAGALVQQLLGLSRPQWEGLRRALKTRGRIQACPRGRSQACDDALLDFLLLRAHAVRSLFLTCAVESQAKQEVKTLRRGQRDFMTRIAPPLKLTCLQIH